MGSDDLVRRWQRGWSACRGWAAPEDARGGLHFRLGLPGREREVFALAADDDPASVRALAREVAGHGESTWLTAPTNRPDEVAGVLAAEGLVVRPVREFLMTRPLADHPVRPAPAPYRVTSVVDDDVVRVEVWDGSGDLAASGLAGLAGADAVPDRIETAGAHRRRGLGAAVMGALAAAAVERGARTGVLLASPDGERLYTALGWTTRWSVVMAVNSRSAS
ncbi:GNAT family N-acetyltransferase [Saccharothrix obliqua]|uniref:GNAT family N-acetyltransferase n=1 Tax=Saccharothrix obliqua TaxID=2861747 RepID=UPI001C60218D|nr:GNAT family N-acetyltransferase [Saccharothrix obliqua]MBW4721930.1 GNAT family N-acetyltransferase [Saccharothrix obliqua]